MFDVNQPETLEQLGKWWVEFKDRAPLEDDDVEGYCVVVVGNKVDLIEGGGSGAVSEEDARKFLDGLVPPAESLVPQTPERIPTLELSPASNHIDLSPDRTPPPSPRPRTHSIDITTQPSRSPRTRQSPTSHGRSRSTGSARFYGGTMTTTHTTQTIYHTPSSSFFDMYESARSSPVPPTSSTRRISIASSTSSTSGVTITPSLFARGNNGTETSATTTPPSPTPPDKGPRLFWTSAKTGKGVKDVFEYVAQRVVTKWEWEEAVENRLMVSLITALLVGPFL
jgi:Ras-related protein Rab-7A